MSISKMRQNTRFLTDRMAYELKLTPQQYNDVYAGIEGGSKEDVKQAAAAKAPWYQRAIKTLGDIFVPIIPAIVASGFLMGIMEALNFMVNNGFLNIDTTGSANLCS